MIEYPLIRSCRKTLGLQIKDGKVIVRAPMRMTKAAIHAFVIKHADWIEAHLAKAAAGQSLPKLTDHELNALAEQAKQVVPARVAHYAHLLGVEYGRITIRTQKTRWGSCSSKGNINLNLNIVRLPRILQDYVLLHELCHLRHHDHGHAFHLLLEHVLTDHILKLMEISDDPETAAHASELARKAAASRAKYPLDHVLTRAIKQYRVV